MLFFFPETNADYALRCIQSYRAAGKTVWYFRLLQNNWKIHIAWSTLCKQKSLCEIRGVEGCSMADGCHVQGAWRRIVHGHSGMDSSWMSLQHPARLLEITLNPRERHQLSRTWWFSTRPRWIWRWSTHSFILANVPLQLPHPSTNGDPKLADTDELATTGHPCPAKGSPGGCRTSSSVLTRRRRS